MCVLKKISVGWCSSVMLVLLSVCLFGCAHGRTKEAVVESPRLVRVKMSGEVYKRGEIMIANSFDLKSFRESVGGFEYGTQIPPSHMMITRLEDGVEKKYRIRFKEMPSYQKKGFRYRDGDQVYVPRIVF